MGTRQLVRCGIWPWRKAPDRDLAAASAICLLLAILVGATLLHAQQPAPPIARATSQEVVVDVVLRDKKGRPVRDLRPEEIRLTDDGTPVTISSIRWIGSGAAVAPAVSGAAGAALDPWRDIRLISLVFEPMNLEAAQLARDAAVELSKRAAAPNTYLGVMTVGQRLRLLQQFTGDAGLIKHAVDLATRRPNERFDAAVRQAERALEQLAGGNAIVAAELRRGDLTSLTPGGLLGGSSPSDSASGQQMGEAMATLGPAQTLARLTLSMLQASAQLSRDTAARPSLASLRAVVDQLVELPGRKAVIYFSEGLVVTQRLEDQFRNLISAANRARVSIYCIDATGLSTTARNEAALQELRAAVEASRQTVTQNSDEAVTRSQVMAFDTAMDSTRMENTSALAELASSTGGFLIADSNDLRRPMQRLVEDFVSYYEVTYVPPAFEFDGRFRRLAVKVDRPNVSVQSRAGYFALPPDNAEAVAAYEVPLLTALEETEPPNAFPLQARTYVLGRPKDGTLESVVAASVPLVDMTFEEDSIHKTFRVRMAVLALVKDMAGNVVHRLSQDIVYQAPIERAEAARSGTFLWHRNFRTPPGQFLVQVALLDRTSGRISCALSAFTASEPPAALYLSDTIPVGRLAQPPTDAPADDPLRYGGSRIVPGVLGPLTDKTDAPALSFFTLIHPAAGSPAAVAFSAEISRDGQPVATLPLELPAPSASGDIPFVASIPLPQLPPGKYEFGFLARQGELTARSAYHFEITGPPAPEARTAGGSGETSAGEATSGSASAADVLLSVAALPVSQTDLRPSGAEQARILEIARERSLAYLKALPNFFCIQTTSRYIDSNRSGVWKRRDVLDELITFVNGRERYTDLGKDSDDTPRTTRKGVVSAGEFGSALKAIFSEKAAAGFRWEGYAEDQGERLHVFTYAVAEPNSSYVLTWEGRPYRRAKPAYQGRVYLHAETFVIRRVTLQTQGVPAGFPLQEAAIEIEYGDIRLSGQDYLLPVSAVVQSRLGKRQLVRNEIRFHDYRAWAAQSNIRYANTPD